MYMRWAFFARPRGCRSPAICPILVEIKTRHDETRVHHLCRNVLLCVEGGELSISILITSPPGDVWIIRFSAYVLLGHPLYVPAPFFLVHQRSIRTRRTPLNSNCSFCGHLESVHLESVYTAPQHHNHNQASPYLTSCGASSGQNELATTRRHMHQLRTSSTKKHTLLSFALRIP